MCIMGLKSLPAPLFVQKFVHANNTENIKAPHLGPLWGESTHVWVQ